MQHLFGIGLSRTGTLSLCRSLEMLGIKTIHFPRDAAEIVGWKWQAAVDITVACRFDFLDKLLPGSKFIYTARDMGQWLDSCERHFTREARQKVIADWEGQVNEENALEVTAAEAEWLLYGSWTFDRKRWQAAYERHDQRVRSYFQDRPNDLLILDICEGDGWEKLLPFLGLSSVPFPWLHKSNAS